MKKTVVTLSLLLMAFSLSPHLYAEPKVIHGIDHNKASIIISDTEYKMALNMKVYNKKRQPLNRYALKIGQKVAIRASNQPGTVRTLATITLIE